MELSQKQALEFKECLQYYLSPNSKKSWVKTLRLLKITPTKVILEGIPHKVYRYEIKNNHEELFIRVLDKLYPEDSPFSDKIFEYKIGVSKRSKKSLQTEFDLNQYSTDEKFEFKMSSNKEKNIRKKKVKFDCSCCHLLDTFIPGKRNLLAIRASRVVVEMPGIAFNPFIIYGESGTGKTHLIEGIYNGFKNIEIKKNNIYISAENFLNDFINNVRLNKMKEFRDLYRRTDFLLIDDFEALLPSIKCQNELLHTIKTLIKNKAQIVIACEKPPTHIEGLSPGLRRLLESGLTVDLGIPDDETKIKILKNKANERGIPISNELANFLVNNFKGGIGRIDGLLTRLGVHASLMNEELTINLAKNVLKDWLNQTKQINTPNRSYHGKHVDDIIDKILERTKVLFQITEGELLSYRREKKHIKARQVAVYLIKKLTTLSLSEIGRILGRNHSTIHATLKKVKERLLEDDFFAKQIQSFLNDLDEKPSQEIPLEQKNSHRL